MAIETRRHGKLVDLSKDIHVLHCPMAIHAPNAFVDMYTMVEIGVIWHLMNTFPRKSDTFFVILCQLDDLRPVLSSDGVAVHADGRSRDAGVCRLRDPRMAVLTVDLHRPRMQFMRKGHRLGGRIPNPIAFCTRDIVGCDRCRECYEKHDREPDLERMVNIDLFHTWCFCMAKAYLANGRKGSRRVGCSRRLVVRRTFDRKSKAAEAISHHRGRHVVPGFGKHRVASRYAALN